MIQVQVQVSGQISEVGFDEDATAQTIYNYIAEKTGIALKNVRVMVNGETVEPDEGGSVKLNTGDFVDIVQEVTNG